MFGICIFRRRFFPLGILRHILVFKDVRGKIFQSIEFFLNFYCRQIMSYLSQKCKKKLGVTVFVSEIKRVVNYTDFEKLPHIIEHGLQRFMVKNIEGESTEENDLSHIL